MSPLARTRLRVRAILRSTSLPMQLLKTQADATASDMPITAGSITVRWMLPLDARGKPAAAVIRLPQTIPGLATWKYLF